MKIALLGSGHIGQTIARLLTDTRDYSVTVIDRDANALAPLAKLGIATLHAPTGERGAIGKAIAGHQTVVNALPYDLAVEVAHAAKAQKCNYFDLTEDVAATDAIRALAADAGTAFMPQCGLAPGFIGIAAYHLCKDFDRLQDVKMRVGALPAFPTNSLKYNLTWSVDGLINEYLHPCDAIRDGKRVDALPLDGLEHFSLDGVEYEAFNTSGGLGTLCETLAGKVDNLDYKSVRYPGHQALMRFLLEELKMTGRVEELKGILRNAVPATMQDVVLIFVTVTGMKKGGLVQEVFARKIFADREAPLSAIQITTAAGICAAVDLFREKKLPQKGFIRQEEIALPEFLLNRFGKAYQNFRRIEAIS